MKLIRGLITNKIGSVRRLIIERIRLGANERVLTCTRICIDAGDLQKWVQGLDFDEQCVLLRNVVREQIQDQFKMQESWEAKNEIDSRSDCR
jgi:hypothetical protein